MRHRASSRNTTATRGSGEAGYSTIEAVITLPAIIVMTMLVVQYALLWHGRHVAEAAARDGVRAARGYQATATDGRDAAASYLAQVAPNLLTTPTVTVDRTATTVTVQVHATVLTVIPLASFDITQHAAGPVERFVP
ncbi:MAG: pilus assembly protein [Kineosporiaceae bacterium]|nr:pilus assembly protein [Kineosporiaceae bacterium]